MPKGMGYDKGYMKKNYMDSKKKKKKDYSRKKMAARMASKY